MKPIKPKPKEPKPRLHDEFHLKWTAFVIMLVAICPLIPFGLRITVLSLLIGWVACVYVCILSDWYAARQSRMRLSRIQRRVRRRQRAVENFEAQLHKPDFESRLQSYVKSDSIGGAHSETDSNEQPQSKMEFWQISAEDYARTPTRPIELLRFLLQRISKLVGQGKRYQ